MSFSNAAKGFKRIYRAEILKLIGYICLIAAAVIFAIGFGVGLSTASSGASDALTLGGTIGASVLVIAFAILYVVAFIMNIVGFVNARNDNENFKTALVFLIVGILFSLVSLFVINNGIGSILYSMSTLSETLATVFVIAGGMQIAHQLGRDDIRQKGSTVIKLIIAVECVTFVISFISTFFRGDTISIISLVLLIGSLLLSFIKYIMYLSFLSKSKKMLSENQ